MFLIESCIKHYTLLTGRELLIRGVGIRMGIRCSAVIISNYSQISNWTFSVLLSLFCYLLVTSLRFIMFQDGWGFILCRTWHWDYSFLLCYNYTTVFFVCPVNLVTSNHKWVITLFECPWLALCLPLHFIIGGWVIVIIRHSIWGSSQNSLWIRRCPASFRKHHILNNY